MKRIIQQVFTYPTSKYFKCTYLFKVFEVTKVTKKRQACSAVSRLRQGNGRKQKQTCSQMLNMYSPTVNTKS